MRDLAPSGVGCAAVICFVWKYANAVVFFSESGVCHSQPWHETQYSFNEGRLGEVDEADWRQLRSQPRGTLQSFPKFLVWFLFFFFGLQNSVSFLPVAFQFEQRRARFRPAGAPQSHFQSTLLATQRAAAAIRPVETDEAFGQKLN